MMDDLQVTSSYTTKFCADSVEWCPVFPYHLNLICGTYQLNENAEEMEKRTGQIQLFRIDSDKFVLKQSVDTYAVLDAKWYSRSVHGKILLAVAMSSGELQIWYIKEGEPAETCLLNFLTKYTLPNNEILTLSVDWSGCSSSDIKISISDSKGNINVLSFDGTSVTLNTFFNAHKYESWITSFNYFNDNIVYSGGDDCILKVHDIRDSTVTILSSNKHSAGVTSLRHNHVQEHILASGSYDEFVRIWDTRQMKRNLSDINIGGGIWRIKWYPNNCQMLFVAAMYNGFHKLMYENTDLELIASLNQSGSLSYGIDVSHTLNEVLAGCTFYDKQLLLFS